jgi:anti-sigma regulatory factor (Ser/Thr protein kinase)
MRTVIHEAPVADDRPAPPVGAGGELWWTFPALPVHARLAQGWLAGWLNAELPGWQEQCYGALVAFSELVTNAALHGVGPITVHVALVRGPHEPAAALPAGAPRRLLCEVTDRGLQGPAVLDGGRDDECHLVLSLADALTTGRWVRRTADGGRTTSFLADLDEGCIVARHRIV